MQPDTFCAAFSNAAKVSGVERSSTTPITTSIPAPSAFGSSSATVARIRPISFRRSTRRRHAGALSFTFAANATFEIDASCWSCLRIARSMRSSCDSGVASSADWLRNFVAHMEFYKKLIKVVRYLFACKVALTELFRKLISRGLFYHVCQRGTVRALPDNGPRP
ncbi:hypothetical protein PCAR4_800009 [Paraburkholderia caribensis]|nr:hypothetical protein PCAR4_800009 [Paraburkholderia caribensis]